MRIVGNRGRGGRRSGGGATGDLTRECRGNTGVSLGSNAGRERLCGVARRHRDLSVRRDADRKLSVDEIDAFGAKAPHQQRGAGKFDFSFRRAGDDGAFAIPDDDVADAHRDANPAGAFNLRAADLNRIAVADIFLDRGRKPGRRHIEVDRPGAEPPPQPDETPAKITASAAITTARRLTQRSLVSQRLNAANRSTAR